MMRPVWLTVIPRRVPDFPDSFHSWNFLSSIGSGITFLSFAMFSMKVTLGQELREHDSEWPSTSNIVLTGMRFQGEDVSMTVWYIRLKPSLDTCWDSCLVLTACLSGTSNSLVRTAFVFLGNIQKSKTWQVKIRINVTFPFSFVPIAGLLVSWS